MKHATAIGVISSAALATTLSVTGIGTSAAQAADGCIPSPGSAPTPTVWTWAGFTEWQTSPDQPADPDGVAGADDLGNLIEIGEGFANTHDDAYRQVVPDGRLRYTDWQKSDDPPPVGPLETIGARYEKPFPNGDATDGAPSQWWNWSPNDSKGPQDYTPAFPVDARGTWQGPHTNGGPDGNGTFNASHNDNGNSSWFHREPGTEANPGTTHTEYQWEVLASHVEYRWSTYTRTIVDGTDPVTCPSVDDPNGGEQPSTDSGTGGGQTPDVQPANDQPTEVLPQDDQPTADQPPEVLGTEAQLPHHGAPGPRSPEAQTVAQAAPGASAAAAAPATQAVLAAHGTTPSTRPAAAVPTIIDAGL